MSLMDPEKLFKEAFPDCKACHFVATERADKDWWMYSTYGHCVMERQYPCGKCKGPANHFSSPEAVARYLAEYLCQQCQNLCQE